MLSKLTLGCQVLWQYLEQPIGDARYDTVLEPRKFWTQYRVRLLERCWMQECSSESHSL